MTTSFCGLPFADPDRVPAGTVAAVVGVGHSLGSPHKGAEHGPFFLRTVSKEYTWAAESARIYDLRHGVGLFDRVVDVGDLDLAPDLTPGPAEPTLTEVLDAVRALVAALPPRVAPCVIGGDHTVTLPIVTALAERREAPFTVVQFDHHLDLQIWDGAPARPREREPIFHTNVMSHVSDVIGPGRLLQVGVSPFATVEEDSAHALPQFLRSIGRQVCVSAPEIDDAPAFREIVGQGEDIYVSVDVDVLDAADMSSTGYPATVGLSTRRLLRLIDLALTDNRLIGFDVVEFAAGREDRSPRTLADAQRAALVFVHLLGWVSRQGNAPART
ncbi:arginase family protein [Streptomyces sp. NPDC059582]|uniref:arginase family protein n=1 Tax=Streptomyces sp. NPDC059582 TaxID=3346875 RepID=UPI0036BB665A